MKNAHFYMMCKMSTQNSQLGRSAGEGIVRSRALTRRTVKTHLISYSTIPVILSDFLFIPPTPGNFADSKHLQLRQKSFKHFVGKLVK